MKKILVLIGAFLLPLLFIAAAFRVEPKTYTLEEALSKKLIKLQSITATLGTDLSLKIENLKSPDVKIQMSSGLEFVSRDTNHQDVIIFEEKSLLVKGGQTATIQLKGYCTEATRRSPRENSGFDLKTVEADAKLKKLADYLKKNKDVDKYLYQHAVWVLTDDHDLRGLYHDAPEKAIAMQKFMSDLSGKPMPKYTVRYNDGSIGEVAFTGETLYIRGFFEYDLEEGAVMTLEVYNEAGEMVQTVFKDMVQVIGHHKFKFELKTMDLPKGKYTSKLTKSGKLFKSMEVEV